MPRIVPPNPHGPPARHVPYDVAHDIAKYVQGDNPRRHLKALRQVNHVFGLAARHLTFSSMVIVAELPVPAGIQLYGSSTRLPGQTEPRSA